MFGNFYDAEEVERVFYPEIGAAVAAGLLPGATDALVYNHDVFDKDYAGDRAENQEKKNPGVNARYANIVHNDLNDNSGRVRCRELLTRNLRNFGREQRYSEDEADAKMSRRFMSINLAKPMETVEQYPFVLCAWPSFADHALHHQLPDLHDDRVGETTRFTYRPGHEWYLVPCARPRPRSRDAEVLRLADRRLGLALVVPHGERGPDRAAGRAVPQERGGAGLRVLLTTRTVTASPLPI